MSNNKNKTENSTSTQNNGIGASVLALSVVISLLVGLIGGFFIGESRASSRYDKMIEEGIFVSSSVKTDDSNDDDDNSQSNPSSDESIFDSINYNEYVINKNLTIKDYYGDNESRYYASKIIGQKVPDFSWVDSAGVTHKISEIAETNDNFIVELLSTSCGYCNASATEVDKYRENTGNVVISLALDSGDLTNFNKAGENTWHLANEDDSAVSSLLQNVPWIPTFLYVEDGVIRLVEFGGVKEADIQASWAIAFTD